MSTNPWECPRLLNEVHRPGPGGPGVRIHNVTRQCVRIIDHAGKHRFEEEPRCDRG